MWCHGLCPNSIGQRTPFRSLLGASCDIAPQLLEAHRRGFANTGPSSPNGVRHKFRPVEAPQRRELSENGRPDGSPPVGPDLIVAAKSSSVASNSAGGADSGCFRATFWSKSVSGGLAEIIWANSDRFRATCGLDSVPRVVEFADVGTNLVEFGIIVGRLRPIKLVELGIKLVDFDPNLADFGPNIWSIPGKIWPKCIKCGQPRSTAGG